MIKVLCINDSNRPPEIPPHKWVVAWREYTITYVYQMVNQRGVQGVTLKELSLEGCEPYDCFWLGRFAFREEDIPKFMELMKLCTEMDQEEIKKEIEKLNSTGK